MTLSRNHHPGTWTTEIALVGRLIVVGALDIEKAQPAILDLWNPVDAAVFLPEAEKWAEEYGDTVRSHIQRRADS